MQLSVRMYVCVYTHPALNSTESRNPRAARYLFSLWGWFCKRYHERRHHLCFFHGSLDHTYNWWYSIDEWSNNVGEREICPERKLIKRFRQTSGSFVLASVQVFITFTCLCHHLLFLMTCHDNGWIEHDDCIWDLMMTTMGTDINGA